MRVCHSATSAFSGAGPLDTAGWRRYYSIDRDAVSTGDGAMVMCMLGPAQIVLLAALALIVFGPKRLPEIGRSLGNALREFQRASAEFMDAVNRPVEEQEPEPPPVKNIEYPTLQAAPGAEQYAALPYGSDFGSDSPGAPHAASH